MNPQRRASRSARDRLRDYFDRNVGRVLDTNELARVAAISEYARRIRELRNDEGMQIQTHNDNPNLAPGQYILMSLERLPIRISHRIDATQRARILEHNGFTCAMCGAMAGDRNPLNPTRRIRLQVDHINPDGPPTDENLRSTCNVCNEGRSNLETTPPPRVIAIQRQIRRLPRDQQRLILNDLRQRLEAI